MRGRSSARIFALIVLLTSFLAATREYVEPSVAARAGALSPRTLSLDDSLPNYDIRLDKSAFDVRTAYLAAAQMSLREIASIREGFSRGEAKLRQSVPSVKIEYNDDARVPEVIGTDVHGGRAFLTRPSTEARPDILRAFLTENSGLIGVDEDEFGVLTTVADYSNPDGNLSFVEFSQEINRIPVFRGEVKAAFTRDRELVRVVNNLAPGINRNSVSTEFGSSTRAVELAAVFANAPPHGLEPSEVTEKRVVFGSGDNATIAEKMYFPVEHAVAVAAWRVAIWGPVNAFYVIVDAKTGTLLWRKNVTEDQTQPATYSVYANPNAMVHVADSPFPFTPGPTAPTGAQGAGISRSSITRIGNEPPYQFNSLGWIADGGSVTDGNAIQAGLDRDGTDGIDPNSEATSATRNFSYSYSPFNPNTNTGDQPVPAPQTYPGSAYQQGTVTQLFYISNWFHDELYRLGFTEQAKNFQNDNFGRGGSSGDRVRAEGQDSNGFNNANFSTFADGIRPRMQMYLWAGPTPDIDGNLDADVVIHEYAHGLSNRLHGNASGLTMNMSRGLGEGWSDFYGHAMLSEPTDAINSIHTTGGYDTYLGVSGYTNNYYYGIRRFPKAVMSFTGVNGRPHNPLTFADADQSQLDVSDGAFARGPYGSDNADAVHNLGEIWSSALWEVRARMINRLGWAVGNRKVLQLVTDGMKLAPLAPTFITERDAILAAAHASSPPTEAAADVADIWAGFAVRGIGASASVQVNGTGLGDARVTQAFDLPNITQIQPITFSDTAGNGNGFPDPGETLQVNIALTNSTGLTANGVTLSLAGGGTADYGTMNGVETASRAVTFSVPANLPCGGVLNLTLNVTSSLGQVTFVRSFSLGSPLTTTSENFDSVSAPQIPNGWTATAYNGGVGFVTTAVGSDSAPNSAFAADPATVGGGTDLISPTVPIAATGATIEFRHRFDTEAAWDGGLLEISIGGAAFQDIVGAGGAFVANGYNSTLGNGTNNPWSGRRAWSGDSRGYVTTVARLPAGAAGQNVQFRWRFGADNNTAPAGGGWNIDGVRIIGNFACAAPNRARADFDGDGKTDVSVYRPSSGAWHLDRSTAGYAVVNFGLSTDVPTPGDFDGDGRADFAVYRPSEGNWYRINSSDASYNVLRFGIAEDIPQPGDFDADGRDDLAVWRPSTGVWYYLRSSDARSGEVRFGLTGDNPVADDYDGDGRDDIAVWRPSNGVWYFLLSATGGQFSATAFGLASDRPVPADFDGDGKCDIAVYRPSEGNWYQISGATSQTSVVRFGLSEDRPSPGDFDGDGKSDQAVYRAGIWYLNRSTAGFSAQAFGLSNDIPIPAKYIP